MISNLQEKNLNRAFGHVVKEWWTFPSTSQRPTAPIWPPGPGLALRPSSKDVCSSSMIWCSPILLRMLQHCIWDPWGALGHILKEWMSFPSTLQRPTANSSNLAAWARFGTLTLFERRLLLQYVLVLPNSSMHVATLYLGPMGSLGA